MSNLLYLGMSPRGIQTSEICEKKSAIQYKKYQSYLPMTDEKNTRKKNPLVVYSCATFHVPPPPFALAPSNYLTITH